MESPALAPPEVHIDLAAQQQYETHLSLFPIPHSPFVGILFDNLGNYLTCLPWHSAYEIVDLS